MPVYIHLLYILQCLSSPIGSVVGGASPCIQSPASYFTGLEVSFRGLISFRNVGSSLRWGAFFCSIDNEMVLTDT